MAIMDINDQAVIVAQNMKKHGGSFVQALGEALLHADWENMQRIYKAWPEYWEAYLKKGAPSSPPEPTPSPILVGVYRFGEQKPHTILSLPPQIYAKEAANNYDFRNEKRQANLSLGARNQPEAEEKARQILGTRNLKANGWKLAGAWDEQANEIRLLPQRG